MPGEHLDCPVADEPSLGSKWMIWSSGKEQEQGRPAKRLLQQSRLKIIETRTKEIMTKDERTS